MAYTTLNIQETVSADHDNDMQSLFNFQNQPLTQARFPKLFSIAHARVRQWVKDIDQLDLALLASRNFYVVPNLIPVAVAKALEDTLYNDARPEDDPRQLKLIHERGANMSDAAWDRERRQGIGGGKSYGSSSWWYVHCA